MDKPDEPLHGPAKSIIVSRHPLRPPPAGAVNIVVVTASVNNK